MREADRAPFAEMMAGIYEFYNRQVSEQGLMIWWEAMKGFELATVRGALSRHVMNPDSGQFIPKPADVVRELSGTRADASMLAWSRVIEGIKSVGSWNSIVFDDPIIHRVIEDLGGWPWLCGQDDSELPFVERRFRDAYRAWLARGGTPHHQPRLIGTFERVNSVNGHPVAPPVMIGEPERCALIASGSGQKPDAQAHTLVPMLKKS